MTPILHAFSRNATTVAQHELAIDPDLWLLDEPFGALDAQTRLTVQSELFYGNQPSKTVIFVTHDLPRTPSRERVCDDQDRKIKSDTIVPIPRPRIVDELNLILCSRKLNTKFGRSYVMSSSESPEI